MDILDTKKRLSMFLWCGETQNRWQGVEEEYTAALEWLSRNLPAGALKLEKEEDGSRSWGVVISSKRIPLIYLYNEGTSNFYFKVEGTRRIEELLN